MLTDPGTRLNTYLENKQKKQYATHFGTKNRKHPNIVNRMVPREKAKLTEMLHEYISAHKFKSASEARQEGGSSGAFTLVTGQSEAIKTEYSAVSLHPREKVNQLLKYRDELRKLARDSSLITGDPKLFKHISSS